MDAADAARSAGSESSHFPIVAVGASAGGLEACRKFLAATPADAKLAFVLVLHLDPNHASMVADLLGADTHLEVLEATEGQAVRPGRLSVIPPGAYLEVTDGVLRLSPRHATRAPFDFLLASLAADAGPRAVCVVLSGTGADGSAGLRAINAAGGLVIAQDPTEAAWSGMPESAIATGLVDHVLPAAEITKVIAAHVARLGARGVNGDDAAFDEILSLVRQKASQDIALYKTGTIERRIDRRMALAGLPADAYLDRLKSDPAELDRLVADLLIHVTSFFRDPKVFEHLAEAVIPELLESLTDDRPLRIWVAGCSTGEEAYSLAILCREVIKATGSSARLQILASDVDPDAIATAREGFYPNTLSSAVSPERLAHHFIRESGGWRVNPSLRDCVVFTVQDLLADPPFSRIDLVSCRNVLIYLGPEAQRRVIGACGFALRPGGLLLLGAAETPGPADGRFEVVDKAARLWRRVGRIRAADLHLPLTARVVPPPEAPANRRTALAETCRRLVLETHAPAAVLLNTRLECLYLLGPTERYLRVPPGHPTTDFVAMAPPGLRVRLRKAAAGCTAENPVAIVPGGRTADGTAFTIELRAVKVGVEAMLLACFLDAPAAVAAQAAADSPEHEAGSASLEAELEALRSELRDAQRDLETAAEEHAAAAAEALSVNEEYQSTNEELLASKEELQSLNEELTALNGQLQETLERHRTTAADLQNVLYSTDVATLFLDKDLCIRFFTPAARALFRVIATDIGRPLSDLAALFHDNALEKDARAVITGAESIMGREVETEAGTWHMRCIQPYRTEEGRIEGVVITFSDVTERHRSATALKQARRVAEQADAAKSRFLAAASHDLRQPLQSLTLIHGLMRRPGADATRLGALLDRTLASMTDMLETLLDVNRIEVGDVRPDVGSVPVGPLLSRLAEELGPLAEERGLELRVRACPHSVRSDPRLLEQMLRNLLSNALKYTARGGVLLGWRRRGGWLRIEVWDTGPGIAANEVEEIFEPYRKAAHNARARERGLGLGLAIVRRLGELLDHGVAVRSRPGRGSVFSVAAAMAPALPAPARPALPQPPRDRPLGRVLVVEDEPDLGELLATMLRAEGHTVDLAQTPAEARRFAADPATRPDVLLSDYDLRGEVDGLRLAAELAAARGAPLPAVILTGDITTAALRQIAASPCVRLAKPATSAALTAAIALLLRTARPDVPAPASDVASHRTVHLIDDDPCVREATRSLFEAEGWTVREHDSAEAFLALPRPEGEVCLVVDERLPGITGVELLTRLRAEGALIPAIVLTGHGDAATAVAALRAGAADFFEKPALGADLLAGVDRAMERARDDSTRAAWRADAAARLDGLTPRERDVLAMVLSGAPNKNIAADLGISQRTVENHRAAVMRKTGAASLPALVRLSLAAASTD